ncbi:hypothetical protein [Acinetobacter sp.]|jgi:hypothetical protein|uniref:hypothetical protein n=1 Tax=Acinetobacter sp. TaxID=472 RepID=UPI0035AFF1E7
MKKAYSKYAFLFLRAAFEKAIKIAKLIVANENTSHLSLSHFIALNDALDCKSKCWLNFSICSAIASSR